MMENVITLSDDDNSEDPAAKPATSTLSAVADIKPKEFYERFYIDRTAVPVTKKGRNGKDHVGKCKFCKKPKTVFEVYGLFKNHIDGHHKTEEDVKNFIAEKSGKNGPPKSQPKIVDHFKKTHVEKYDKKHRKQMDLYRDLGICLTDSLVSINALTLLCWQNMISNQDEKLTWPSQKTFIRMILPDLEKTIEDNLTFELADAIAVAITFDLWSSKAVRSYCGVTVHYITRDGKLRSFLLGCPRFPGSHTAQRIFELVQILINKFNIRDKVFYVGTDNGANVLKAFEDWMPGFISFADLLEEYRIAIEDGTKQPDEDRISEEDLDPATEKSDELNRLVQSYCCLKDRTIQVRCLAHTLQLCLKGPVAKCAALHSAIEKLAKAVNSAKKSNLLSEAINAVFGKAFLSRCSTRWNTNFLMVERAVEFNWAEHGNIFKEKHRLNENDLKILREFVEITKHFEHMFKLLQSAEYPAVCQVILAVYHLKDKLKKFARRTDFGLVVYAKELLAQVEERFRGIDADKLYIAALFLDPNYKMGPCDTVVGGLTSQTMKMTVLDLLSGITLESKKSVADVTTVFPADFDPFAGLLKPKLSAPAEASSNELSAEAEVQLYLCDNSIPSGSKVNPLDFWYNNAKKYKRLSVLAKQVLCAPATTAAVEMVFSVAGLLLSPRRLRTSDDNFELLLMCQVNGELRLKKRNAKRGIEDVE